MLFSFKYLMPQKYLKATRATYSILGLNENFTEWKSGNKSLFQYLFEKLFCQQFYF